MGQPTLNAPIKPNSALGAERRNRLTSKLRWGTIKKAVRWWPWKQDIIIGGSCHKYHFYFCRDKHVFVATKLFLRQIFVATNTILSPQAYFCRDKHVFVATKDTFCRDKSMPVATKDVFCRDKHIFVATKMMLVAAPFCRDNNDTCGSSRQW